MDKNTFEALNWIIGILDSDNIPYRVGGGLATFIYGSARSVNDIDISLSGKYFPRIVDRVKEYITDGPKHYLNSKWDCITLSLEYKGQEIDLTDSDTLLMSSKDNTKWVKNIDIYKKHPDIKTNFQGLLVNLMNPRVLIEYKKELSGDHQKQDIIFLEKYIKNNL